MVADLSSTTAEGASKARVVKKAKRRVDGQEGK